MAAILQGDTIMAASPVAANGSDNTQANEKWSATSNSQPESIPPIANGPETNGSGSRPEEQPESQQSERLEDSASPTTFASGNKEDAPHRGEKQIKVLVWSYFVSAVFPVFAICAGVRMVLALSASPLPSSCLLSTPSCVGTYHLWTFVIVGPRRFCATSLPRVGSTPPLQTASLPYLG